MCQGFGTIVTKDGNVYFTMFDYDGDVSHSEIIEALGIKENGDRFKRTFVRTENTKWTEESFRFETESDS